MWVIGRRTIALRHPTPIDGHLKRRVVLYAGMRTASTSVIARSGRAMVEKLTTSAAVNEPEGGQCEICGKALRDCVSVITITIDTERAGRVYGSRRSGRKFFRKHYRYCSLEHAKQLFESYPYLSSDYYEVTRA